MYNHKHISNTPITLPQLSPHVFFVVFHVIHIMILHELWLHQPQPYSQKPQNNKRNNMTTSRRNRRQQPKQQLAAAATADAFAAAFPGEVPPDPPNPNPVAVVQEQPCQAPPGQQQNPQQQPRISAAPHRRQPRCAPRARSHFLTDMSHLSAISLPGRLSSPI